MALQKALPRFAGLPLGLLVLSVALFLLAACAGGQDSATGSGVAVRTGGSVDISGNASGAH